MYLFVKETQYLFVKEIHENNFSKITNSYVRLPFVKYPFLVLNLKKYNSIINSSNLTSS